MWPFCGLYTSTELGPKVAQSLASTCLLQYVNAAAAAKKKNKKRYEVRANPPLATGLYDLYDLRLM